MSNLTYVENYPTLVGKNEEIDVVFIATINSLVYLLIK